MDFILTDPARFLRERKKAKDRCEGLLREMQTPKSFCFRAQAVHASGGISDSQHNISGSFPVLRGLDP